MPEAEEGNRTEDGKIVHTHTIPCSLPFLFIQTRQRIDDTHAHEHQYRAARVGSSTDN